MSTWTVPSYGDEWTVPGYTLGFWLNLFSFRQRTAAFRLALSLPLSISTASLHGSLMRE